MLILNIYRSSSQKVKLISRGFFEFLQLHHKTITQQSLRDNQFSDTFHHIFTNTKPISVCIASFTVAHAKISSCWINRKSHFSSSFISYRSYHKCSRRCISGNLKKNSQRSISIESKKMVWITDLDNPQVKAKNYRKSVINHRPDLGEIFH